MITRKSSERYFWHSSVAGAAKNIAFLDAPRDKGLSFPDSVVSVEKVQEIKDKYCIKVSESAQIQKATLQWLSLP